MCPSYKRLAELDFDDSSDNQYRVKVKPQLEHTTARQSRRTARVKIYNGMHRRQNVNLPGDVRGRDR